MTMLLLMMMIEQRKVHGMRYDGQEEQENVVRGSHYNGETCLLCINNNQWIIHQIRNHSTIKTLFVNDFDAASEYLVSELEYLKLHQLFFFATATNALFVDFHKSRVIASKISITDDNDTAIAAAWNCEQDCIAIAFKSGRVKVFYVNYESYELQVLSEDRPDHKGDDNVYLGWGDVKKQFKGKGGATYLNEFHPPTSTYRDSCDRASLSWQFGEKFFSVNCLVNNERVIRIFDNECRLYHTINSQKVPGLCFTTVYRSKRNTLATICKGSSDLESYVVLHERNGGYQTKIAPTDKANVQNIAFSNCGRYFAMESNDNTYRLDIYVQSNFLWIHKFRFRGREQQKLINFKFLPSEDVITLELLYTQGVILYELIKSLTHHDSCVFVQNSASLIEFNYKQAVIPPCGIISDTLRCKETINHIVVNENKHLLAAIDANEMISLFQRRNEQWEMLKQINLRKSFLPITWFKFTLTTNTAGHHILVCIGCAQDNSKSMQKIINIDEDNSSTESIIDRVEYLHNILNQPGFNIISAQNSSGVAIKNAICLKTNTIIVLTTQGRLCLNNMQLSDIDHFTSMLNYADLYLLLTLTKPDDAMDRLLCIDLVKLCMENVEIKDISWSRHIEKGATLISHGKDDGEVVLEMPRGNIELIHVRPIVLRQIVTKIHEGRFYEAYHIVRRYAMKLDLLYDLAPALFIENIDKFVESLGNTESVIKFLLPLRDTSTLTSQDKLFVTGDENFEEIDGKKEDICDAMIKSYRNNCDPTSFAFYRVVCVALLVKHNQNTLEPLRFLAGHHKGRYTAQSLRTLADAIILLKQYGEVNEMYKQAVGLYDIELASTIAQVSGMDPQIYRRFLETCYESDAITRRFQMANEASNFKSAALYLLILQRNQCKTTHDLLEYVQENDCLEYVHTKMNKFDGDAFKTVTSLLVDKFLNKFMYKQAAAVLCKADMPVKAVEYLIRGNHRPEALTLIEETEQFCDKEKTHWFTKVAESCCSHGRYKEAAGIYSEQCKDVDKALDSLLSGYLFKEFVELLQSQDSLQHKQLYEEKLKEALNENLKSTETSLEKLQMNFQTHYERLKVVRESRKHRAEHCLDADDAYSECGSLTTRSHTSASTTTRRTRKLEVKLRSLRHGGKFEDIALMRELFENIANVYELTKDMNQLYDIYLQFTELQPKDINNKLAHFQAHIKQVADEIWPYEYSTLDDSVLSADFYTENMVFLSAEHRTKPIQIENHDYTVAFK